MKPSADHLIDVREHGVDLVSGGTDNHLLLVGLRGFDDELTGKEAQAVLDLAVGESRQQGGGKDAGQRRHHAGDIELIAIANDYSYDDIFTRQVDAFVEEGDVCLAISTSGKYPEYDKVWQDKAFKVVAVFGKYDDGATSGDAGISAYNRFEDEMNGIGQPHNENKIW